MKIAVILWLVSSVIFVSSVTLAYMVAEMSDTVALALIGLLGSVVSIFATVYAALLIWFKARDAAVNAREAAANAREAAANAQSARQTAADAKHEATNTSNVVDQIHTAVNSQRTALEAKVEELRKQIEGLLKEKIIMQEKEKGVSRDL